MPCQVVYLPTTFMEENFDAASLPLNCEMVVEADGMMVPGETHHVTIKAVPRQVRAAGLQAGCLLLLDARAACCDSSGCSTMEL